MSSLSLPLPGTARRAAFGKIVLNEARLAWRRPIGLIGGVGLPVLLLVIFGELPGSSSPGNPGRAHHIRCVRAGPRRVRTRHARAGGPPDSARHLPRAGGPAPPVDDPGTPVLAACRAGRGPAVRGADRASPSSRREHRRLRGARPEEPCRVCALVSCCAVAGLFPIGLVIAAVARTANGANVIGRLVFFPLMFFAGLWLPRALMPGVLLDISNYTPLGAAVQAMQDSMLRGTPRRRRCWSWRRTRWSSASWRGASSDGSNNLSETAGAAAPVARLRHVSPRRAAGTYSRFSVGFFKELSGPTSAQRSSLREPSWVG